MAGRRKQSGRAKQSAALESPDHMRDRVLGAFDRWLAAHHSEAQRKGIYLDVAKIACQFKDTAFGEPNPADWPAGMFAELIGEVFPAKTVGIEGEYARTVVPAMLVYLDFLLDTGRWKTHNDANRSRRELLDLADSLPQRFDDPARMSMTSRLISLALSEGIDPADSAAMSGFIERFNKMPFDWRRKLTDGPNLRESEDADTQLPLDDMADPYREGMARATALLCSKLDFGKGTTVRVTVPTAAQEAEALRAMKIVARMRVLVDWVAPGRAVTKTGAMRRADTVDWMDRFGLSRSPLIDLQSMWDIRDIALPWSAAIESRMLQLVGAKVRPGPEAGVFDSADLTAQVTLGRRVVNLLLQRAMTRPDLNEEYGKAMLAILVPMFVMLCRPGGLDLGYLRDIAEQGSDPARIGSVDLPTVMLCTLILAEIRNLADFGLLVDIDSNAKVPRALRPAVVATIQQSRGPFELRLAGGAVPLGG